MRGVSIALDPIQDHWQYFEHTLHPDRPLGSRYASQKISTATEPVNSLCTMPTLTENIYHKKRKCLSRPMTDENFQYDHPSRMGQTGCKAQGKSWLDHIAIDVDLTSISFLMLRFSEHELAHPVDTLVARLDGEMVRLPRRGAKDALLLGRGHELEAKGRRIGIAISLLAAELQGLESGVELIRRERRTSDGVFVYVDVLEGIFDVLISVHGETGAVEAEVVLVPFVT